jgi:hypothetical protein
MKPSVLLDTKGTLTYVFSQRYNPSHSYVQTRMDLAAGRLVSRMSTLIAGANRQGSEFRNRAEIA